MTHRIVRYIYEMVFYADDCDALQKALRELHGRSIKYGMTKVTFTADGCKLRAHVWVVADVDKLSMKIWKAMALRGIPMVIGYEYIRQGGNDLLVMLFESVDDMLALKETSVIRGESPKGERKSCCEKCEKKDDTSQP